MRVNKYRISKHAARRMARRNLSVGDVALVLWLGHKEHRTGADFFFLGERDVPPGLERALERLVGTTVVAVGGCILTVYRNKGALSKIKRKLKWRLCQHRRDEFSDVALASAR